MKRLRIHIYLLILPLLAGCTSPRLEREWKDTPMGFAYKPDNIYSAESLPSGFKRVVVLPFSHQQLAHDMMPEVETAVINALRRQARFEIVQVASDELYQLLGNDNLTFDKPIPAKLLETMQTVYHADGILQTEITTFRPYKPILIGIKSRLFTSSANQVLWSCDELFDAGNEKIAMGARLFAEKELEQPYPLQSSYSALISPQRFASFVGQALFETIPPRAVLN